MGIGMALYTFSERACVYSMELYEEIHNIIENKSSNYMEDIIAKAEKWFSYIFNVVESFLKESEICEMLPELKSIFRLMAFPFFYNEEKEKFLLIKIIIPLLEKIKLNKTQIQTQNFELKEENFPNIQNLSKKFQTNESMKSHYEKLFNDFNANQGYLNFCSTLFTNLLYPAQIESEFSIYSYLFEYIEYNLQKMKIDNDEEIKKEIQNLIEYLSKFNSSKNTKNYFELIIFYLKMYLKKYEFFDESLLQFEKNILEENLEENNFLILLHQNLYDFKYNFLSFIEKKTKDNSNSIQLYVPTKSILKNSYINAIIFENEFTKNEILILKINLENNQILKESNIIKIIQETSENLNIFKKFEKIYINFDNKLIGFNDASYTYENIYKLLQEELSESINKLKLKKDIKLEESKYEKLMEKLSKSMDSYGHSKEIEEKIKILVKDEGNITYNLKKLYHLLNDENNNLESEQNHINNKEFNEINCLKQDLESLKLKNKLIEPFTNDKILPFNNRLRPIACYQNEYLTINGVEIDIEKYLDKNYDLEKSINNLKKINIIDKIFKGYSAKELKKLIEEKVINSINVNKIIDFNKILTSKLDELFSEKLKIITYKIRNLRQNNSKKKELLILKNNMYIKNPKISKTIK